MGVQNARKNMPCILLDCKPIVLLDSSDPYRRCEKSAGSTQPPVSNLETHSTNSKKATRYSVALRG